MQRYPLSISDNTPGYSNMAFQILSYAAEKITSTPFPELIKRHLIKPLNLKRTFVTSPGDAFPDSVIIPQAWDLEMGDLAPYVPLPLIPFPTNTPPATQATTSRPATSPSSAAPSSAPPSSPRAAPAPGSKPRPTRAT